MPGIVLLGFEAGNSVRGLSAVISRPVMLPAVFRIA